MSYRWTQEAVDRFNAIQNPTDIRITLSQEREAKLHDEIEELCRVRGYKIIHSRMDRRSTVGIGTPDFTIFLPQGKVLCVECKAGDNKLSEAQNNWMAALRRLNHVGMVATTLEQVVREIERTHHGRPN